MRGGARRILVSSGGCRRKSMQQQRIGSSITRTLPFSSLRHLVSRRRFQRTTSAALCCYCLLVAPKGGGLAMAFSSSTTTGAGSNDESSCIQQDASNSVLLQALQNGGTFQDPNKSGDGSSPSLSWPLHPHMVIHHIKEPVGSTQDEARRILQERDNVSNQQPSSPQDDDDSFFAVVADQQQAGRGTNGRSWESSQGNLYLTVGIPMARIPVMLTLLPLQIAVLVAERAEWILQHCANKDDDNTSDASPPFRVRVKWPNDVLLNDAKLSGTLIESASTNNHETWFLIGIGVNVQHAPSLAQSPGKQIRPAVSLQDCCSQETSTALLPPRTALYLGIDLAYALADWVTTSNSQQAINNQAVLEAWKARADFGKAYEIRSNDVSSESTGQYQGETVVAVDIASDGQLKIRGANGQERLLVADYFF